MTGPNHIGVRDRFVLLSALAFVCMTMLAGPLRMFLSQAGLSPLIYVPNLMLLSSTGWQILAEPRERGFTAMHLIALLIPAYALCIGLQFLPPVQSAMGAYVLLPFWFGLACGTVLLAHWRSIAPFIPVFWLIAVSGVLLNQVVEYPWEGFGYNVGNLDVEGSRQWYATGGGKRLAGFSRSSFDAATQVQLIGILMALQTRNPLLRTLCWVVTIAAIVPTNSKGILMVSVVLTPIVILRTLIPQTLLRGLPAFFGALGLAMPTSTLMFSFNSPLKDPTLANATYSFYDRLNYMWPEAWELLIERGHMLLGRGIGGIGTAQTYFESTVFNAGDNIFMYWFVVFGWVALPGFLLLLLRSLRLKPFRSDTELRVYCLLLALLVYGAMTNIVENAIFALIAGIVVRWLASTPRHSSRQSMHRRIAGAPAT